MKRRSIILIVLFSPSAAMNLKLSVPPKTLLRIPYPALLCEMVKDGEVYARYDTGVMSPSQPVSYITAWNVE